MYRRILVPIDGSATAARGLQEALRLAAALGARVRLVNVVDEYIHVNGFENCGAYLDDVIPRLRAAGGQLLREGCAQAAAQGVPADSVLVMGSGDRICDLLTAQARAWDADLVVMGTHGRRGVQRALLGSDAEQMLRIAAVPVLLVRSAR